jgi:hypothetical protein
MEKPGRSAERYERRLLRIGLAAAFLVAAFIPALPLWAEDRPEVSLSVDPASPRTGEPFSLVLSIDAPPDSVAIEGPKLPEGLAMQGAEKRDWSGPDGGDAASGKSARGTRITMTIVAVSDGEYIIPPILVHTDRFETKTGEIVLAFNSGLPQAESLSARWIAPASGVYMGQPFGVSIALQGQARTAVPDSVTVPDGAFLEKLPATPGGLVASYLLTAVKPGQLELGAVRLVLGTRTVVVPPVRIRILPLPASAAETGAVGSFTASTRVQRSTVPSGGTAEVSYTISGTGSLLSLAMPRPLLSRNGLKAADEDAELSSREDSSVEAGPGGYSGSRRVVWQVLPRKSGRFEASFRPYAVFSPESGSVSYLVPPAVAFTVADPTPSGVAARGKGPGGTGPLAKGGGYADIRDLPLETDFGAVLRSTPFTGYRDPVWYILMVLPGCALLFLVVRKISGRRPRASGKALAVLLLMSLILSASAARDGRADRFSQAVAAYGRGDWVAASSGFGALLNKLPDNPILLYDRSLTLYHAGFFAQAVRDAERLERFKGRLAALPRELAFLEPLLMQSGGMGRTTSVRVTAYPGIFFWTAAIFLWVLVFSAFFYEKKKRGLVLIIVVSASVLSLASFACLASSAAVLSTPYAVAAAPTGTGAKKSKTAAVVEAFVVPDPASRAAFSLAEGTTVGVQDILDDFILVETTERRSGWVPRSDLLLF